jgi:hypothetical protein
MITAGKDVIFFPDAFEGKTLIWEFDMEKVDGTPIYWLGHALGCLLLALKQSYSPVIINNALDAKNELEHFITLKGLPLSKIVATQIIKDINNLMHECIFRGNPTSHSGASRPLIPGQSVQ